MLSVMENNKKSSKIPKDNQTTLLSAPTILSRGEACVAPTLFLAQGVRQILFLLQRSILNNETTHDHKPYINSLNTLE